MVKFISRVGGNTSSFLALATVTIVLAACGGGSGDSTPLGEQDFDLDGIINSEDDDADGDGIPDIEDTFVDLDSDGLDDLTNSTLAEAEAAAEPQFTPVSVANPCGSEAGTINDASTPAWNDNCEVRRDGQFANSRYTVGIQRIVYCSGFGTADSYVGFADGLFGPNTEAAVRDFQAADLSDFVDSSLGATEDDQESLDPIGVDGRVGPETWAKLQARLDLLDPGDSATNPENTWGFLSGRCAGIPMFYQSYTASNNGVTLGGWTLARNDPNEAESIKFSKDPVGDL